MENQNCSPDYQEIYQNLKDGASKIKRDLKKNRNAKLSKEIRKIREELCIVLNSVVSDNPDHKHVWILINAIWRTKKQLEATKVLFHSKGLQKICIDADNLLKKYRVVHMQAKSKSEVLQKK